MKHSILIVLLFLLVMSCNSPTGVESTSSSIQFGHMTPYNTFTEEDENIIILQELTHKEMNARLLSKAAYTLRFELPQAEADLFGDSLYAPVECIDNLGGLGAIDICFYKNGKTDSGIWFTSQMAQPDSSWPMRGKVVFLVKEPELATDTTEYFSAINAVAGFPGWQIRLSEDIVIR